MSQSAPWHQRFTLVRVPREFLRQSFFTVLRSALMTDDGRDICNDALKGLVVSPPAGLRDLDPGYEDLGRPRRVAGSGQAPIFLTARFRSGSTLLWNIFRNVPGCTAYYEPLNERRWFDPATRGSRVDPSHRVSDYWTEYEGLTALAPYHRQDWTYRNLYMDATAWDPAMAEYIRLLTEARAATRAVLQFNRIDFRLEWIRRHFPRAILVHLYRHPRDEWASAGQSFYIREWARDLKHHFPFVDEARCDGYELFYYVWRLSFQFGATYADYTLRYEDLIASPVDEIEKLMRAVGIEAYNAERLAGLIVSPPRNRWRELASDQWFAEREKRCEAVLNDFLAGLTRQSLYAPPQRWAARPSSVGDVHPVFAYDTLNGDPRAALESNLGS